MKTDHLPRQTALDPKNRFQIQKVVFNAEEIWYRVRVGSYDNYNSAKIAADALSSALSMPTWVDFVRKEQ